MYKKSSEYIPKKRKSSPAKPTHQQILIHIPRTLYSQTKHTAKLLGIPYSSLITDAIKEKLSSKPTTIDQHLQLLQTQLTLIKNSIDTLLLKPNHWNSLHLSPYESDNNNSD